MMKRTSDASPRTLGIGAVTFLSAWMILGCAQDWSVPARETTDGTDGDDGGEIGGPDADSDADGDDGDAHADDDGDDGRDADDAGVSDADARPICGNGVVEPPEECDGDSLRSCALGPCSGTEACIACMWEACDLGAPPPEDTCATTTATIPDAGVASVHRGTTCGAADDGAVSTCGGSGAPDVVYRLELTRRRRVTLDTRGSAFHAVLRLIEGPACPGTDLACNAGGAGTVPPQARLDAVLDAGTYWIVIDGAAAADAGNYVLNAAIEQPPAPPPNDTCSTAVRLPASDSPLTRTGTTLGAGNYSAGCAGAAGPDVWYTFTLPDSALVYLDTLDGESWNSVLDVRSGWCAATRSLACAAGACGTGRSQWVGRLDAGMYYVLVDGRTIADAGDFVLRIQAIAGGCAAAAAPIAADGTYTGDTRTGSNHAAPGCVSRIMFAPDDVYYFALCPGRTPAATTCDNATAFDTVLAIYAAACDAGAPFVVCNDNMPSGACTAAIGGRASEVVLSGADPGLYLLVVDGFALSGLPSSGPYGLVISGL